MPLIRPDLDELYARAKTFINIGIPGADANLQKNVLNVISMVVAELTNGNYGYLAFLALQIFGDTAEAEYLLRLCAIRGLPRKVATKASGNVIVSGADGSVISTGEQIQRQDGAFYDVTADVTIASGVALVNVLSETVGIINNCQSGTFLNFVSPPPGVNTTALVDANGIAGGTDLESDDDFRARYLYLIRNPPQGSAVADYEIWVTTVPGVTKAFIYPLENGYGTVTIRFLVTPTDSNPNGIPDSGQIAAVAAYVETKRPVTAKLITYDAPIPTALNFNIHLENADNSDIRAAIITELKAMLFRDAVPQGGSGSGISGTIYVSRINSAISLAAGEFAHVLVSPTTDVTYTVGEIAVFGAVVFS